jgi:hypothetical protein
MCTYLRDPISTSHVGTNHISIVLVNTAYILMFNVRNKVPYLCNKQLELQFLDLDLSHIK